MARSPDEMGEVLMAYAEVLNNLRCAEMVEMGTERATLGLVAAGIARWLRRQPWRNEDERREGFALAAGADEVSRKCLARPRPRGQA